MIDIYVLLQQKPPQVVALKCIKFLEKNELSELGQLVLQFSINFLGRTYRITHDTLDTIDDEEEMREVLVDIYESETVEKEELLLETVKDFLHKFLNDGFENGLLTLEFLSTWIKFLKAITIHPEIPENCIFKGKALHFMSLLLTPLCHKSAKDGHSQVELKELINSTVRHISIGFKYRTLCVPIAHEFVYVMESYNEILADGPMTLYKKMLLQENNVLHSMALKSLKKLCENDELKAELSALFFDHETDEEDEDNEPTFMEIIKELSSRKNLKMDVIALMKAVNNLPGQHDLVKEIHQELDKNVFSKTKKLMAETVDLIKQTGDNLWMVIINVMKSDLNDGIDLPHFVTMLLSLETVDGDLKAVLKILLENLVTDPKVSQNAAALLLELFKHDAESSELFLEILDTVLDQCLEDVKTFTLLLECFFFVDIEKMSAYFRENPAKLSSTVAGLSAAFEKFDDDSALFNIVEAMKKLNKMSSYVLEEVRKLFDIYYHQLMTVHEQHHETKPFSVLYKKPITKLTVLLENRAWNLLTTKSMEKIYHLNQEVCRESEDPIFPFALRFHTNFLKHIWTRVLLNQTIPFEIENLAEAIESFFSSLCEILEPDRNPNRENCYVLCCLLDLAVMFQPKMCERSSHEIFQKTQFLLQKDFVKSLAYRVEKYVFENPNSDSESHFLGRLVLHSWIVFCKDYDGLPSLTSSQGIVSHYRLKDPFKNSLEVLMKHLLNQKTIFEQTIAISTLNFANQKDMTAFRSFHQSIEDFLTRQFTDVTKRLSVTSTICSFILTKLKGHVSCLEGDADDRLLVLDYVLVLCKDLDLHVKQKLTSFIPVDLNLTDFEKNHLETFKMSLQQ